MASQVPTETPSDRFFIFLLTLGQIVGVFPIQVLEGERGHIAKFRWISFKTIYSIFTVVVQSWILGTCVYFGYVSGWNFRHIVRSLFYASNLWCTISLLQLLRKWPKLIQKWNRVQESMENIYGFPKHFDKRCKITAAVVIVYCICQITIFFIYNFLQTREAATKRNLVLNWAFYFPAVFPQVFRYFPYSIFTGILCQMNYIFCILRMAYTDLFISLLSSFLSIRFQQITARLSLALTKKRSLEFWREMREDYCKIACLCRAVDDVVTNVVFVSYAGNLILLLVYLRNSTVVDGMDIQKLYNVLNFGTYLIRILLISLYVAWVNDESKEPAFILNSVSTTQYNSEIQRFLLQLSFNDVAFTGNKMFRVTRSIILHIGGVVLTYELVLVQFSELNISA